MGGPNKNSRKKAEMKDFHVRLKYVMERRLKSQLALSKVIGVSQPLIHYWLKGSDLPRKYHAQELAWALNVSYTWLIHGKGSPFGFKRYPIEEFWSSFPERLSYLLWRRKMNLIQLKAAVEKETVNMWLDTHRVPTADDFRFLANYFDCDVNWLISGTFLPDSNNSSEFEKWKLLNYNELFLLS